MAWIAAPREGSSEGLSAEVEGDGEREMVAAPKEAAVAKRVFVPGTTALPKRTAVPAGEERASLSAGQPSVMGSMDRKPV